jgi:Zn-dependent protease
MAGRRYTSACLSTIALSALAVVAEKRCVTVRAMDLRHALEQALLNWIFFIPLLTFHEWAHAWTAWKCGDDTAYKLGRVSLNPIVHMDLVGTVILPLAGMISGAMGGGVVFVGWGNPVPV